MSQTPTQPPLAVVPDSSEVAFVKVTWAWPAVAINRATSADE